MTTLSLAADDTLRPLTAQELEAVAGGGIIIEADSDYFGIEISAFGYGVAVWFTGGSACGEVRTPGGRQSGCTPPA